jgi:hypothetical protein
VSSSRDSTPPCDLTRLIIDLKDLNRLAEQVLTRLEDGSRPATGRAALRPCLALVKPVFAKPAPNPAAESRQKGALCPVVDLFANE